jgi:hypothetical protein
VTLQQTGIRYPRRKAVLLKEWRERSDMAKSVDPDANTDKI